MKFKTVAEAFNFYRNYTNEQIEKRAQEVQGMIETDPDVDIQALNIELTGLKEAKDNNAENEARAKDQDAEKRSMNILASMNIQKPAGKDFSGMDPADSAEYRSAFFKTVLGKGNLTADEKKAFDLVSAEAEKRADVYTTSTEAAVVLPTQTLNEIVKKARTMGGLISECRAFSVPAKISVPVATPVSAADWHTEGASVDSEAVEPIAVVFDGYEIVKVLSISAKVRKMSIAAFESYLVDELTASVMATIENALVNGTGSGQGTGILPGITWVTSGTGKNTVVADAAGITYADILETIALLKRGYAAGAKFAMNNATLYRSIYGLVDGNERPIFIVDAQGEKVGKILGFDVVIDDNIPDDTVLFGNFAQYMAYNMPEGVVVESSDQSSFRKALIDFRALAIADCKPIVPEAFVKLIIAEG